MPRQRTAARTSNREKIPADDPIRRFKEWYAAAEASPMSQPEAMALATSDKRGRASVRYVLLKQVDERGFVFFTNMGSRKGREIKANPYVSFAIHWKPIDKQVRVEGRIERVSDEEADTYWDTRPRLSQLGALASHQSAVITHREILTQRWLRLEQKYRNRAVPRPREWTGVRIIPDRIEFWEEEEHRLHHRDLYVRSRSGWRRQLLQP
ncbi:MAG: pyridoxamine 5'-phosphate oxidase [Deltaproteobacteria bacterium]|nr:pyridoxamine 5'-phosphate oxidase [Deltaproteobacteria bacterium]